jgi:hypothetical protein
LFKEVILKHREVISRITLSSLLLKRNKYGLYLDEFYFSINIWDRGNLETTLVILRKKYLLFGTVKILV